VPIRRVELVGRRSDRCETRAAAQPPTAFHPDRSSAMHGSAHAGQPWWAPARTISISCSSVSEVPQTHRSSRWRQGRSFIALNTAQTLTAAPALFGSATVLRTARHTMPDLRPHLGGSGTGREM